MNSPIRILHLEDNPSDAALVRSTLDAEKIPCQITCVSNRKRFVESLEQGGFDLVLSDYSLPTFDGISAAKLVRDRWPDIPLILVSGTLGEERAVDALKNGAIDYVLKDRMARLAPAIRRAMKEFEERQEKKRLQAQFIEAQKMEVIGQLASGVAHDFNNILGVIMGYSDLLIHDPCTSPGSREYLEEIQHAAERATALTRQLLVFSRKQTVQPSVLDLNKVVQDTGKMLRRLIDENIEMTIKFGVDVGSITSDTGYIGQLLMNLVVNARDAMPNGGRIMITTRNDALDTNGAQAIAGANPGDYIVLSVSDTGVGMTDEVKARLFEAFFTTKSAGKGTGLGLATCKSIVEQFGGHIVVHSQLGQGTTFEIYFPKVAPVEQEPHSENPEGFFPRGTETLLVVEDEPAIRLLVRNVLEAAGYEVLLASNGKDALDAARERRTPPVRLVITDVIMPGMNGMEMTRSLKADFPDVKLLFTSGYTDDAIGRHGLLDPGVEFLQKPYMPAVLLQKVRDILDGNGS